MFLMIFFHYSRFTVVVNFLLRSKVTILRGLFLDIKIEETIVLGEACFSSLPRNESLPVFIAAPLLPSWCLETVLEINPGVWPTRY